MLRILRWLRSSFDVSMCAYTWSVLGLSSHTRLFPYTWSVSSLQHGSAKMFYTTTTVLLWIPAVGLRSEDARPPAKKTARDSWEVFVQTLEDKIFCFSELESSAQNLGEEV